MAQLRVLPSMVHAPLRDHGAHLDNASSQSLEARADYSEWADTRVASEEYVSPSY